MSRLDFPTWRFFASVQLPFSTSNLSPFFAGIYTRRETNPARPTYRSPNARRQTPNTKYYTLHRGFLHSRHHPLPTKLTRHPLIIPPANIPPPPPAPPIPPIRRTLHKQRQHGQHEHNHGRERRHDDDARPLGAVERAIRTGRVRAHDPAAREIEAVEVEEDDGDVVGVGRVGGRGG